MTKKRNCLYDKVTRVLVHTICVIVNGCYWNTWKLVTSECGHVTRRNLLSRLSASGLRCSEMSRIHMRAPRYSDLAFSISSTVIVVSLTAQYRNVVTSCWICFSGDRRFSLSAVEQLCPVHRTLFTSTTTRCWWLLMGCWQNTGKYYTENREIVSLDIN